jgi:hypothetical protein
VFWESVGGWLFTSGTGQKELLIRQAIDRGGADGLNEHKEEVVVL